MFEKKRTKSKKKTLGVSLLIFSLLIFSFSLTSADLFLGYSTGDSLGTFEQNTDVDLIQTCGNCTYCNFTRIKSPSSLDILSNLEADSDGTYYNHTLNSSQTITLGDYNYCFDCGNDAESETGCIHFEITPSGRSGSSNMVFILIIVILTYAVGFLGFFGKNMPISALGGGAMMALGIYMINEGIVIYRDWITNYFSYLTIGLGAIFALVAIVEFVQDNM